MGVVGGSGGFDITPALRRFPSQEPEAQRASRSAGGLEVATARQYMFERPWYTFASSAAIFLAVYSMNILGDAVRERLDPRLRHV